jgi:hypothetical protein
MRTPSRDDTEGPTVKRVIDEYGTRAPRGSVCPACRQPLGPGEPARRGYRRPEDAANLVPAYWHADRCPQAAASQVPRS